MGKLNEKIVNDPNRILILNKIEDRIYEIDRNEEIIIDPAGNPIILSDFIGEYRDSNKLFTGLIFKEDGSTMVLYKDIVEVYTKFAEEYEWFTFDPKTYCGNYDHSVAAERMDELALKSKDKTITEKEHLELSRIINFFKYHTEDIEH